MMRPEFGQPVTITAIAEKRRKFLSDTAIKTVWQYKELPEPLQGLYITYKKGREGTTDTWNRSMSFMDENGYEPSRRFIPSGEGIELWLIALPDRRELIPVFPNDCEWDRPEADPGMENLL